MAETSVGRTLQLVALASALALLALVVAQNFVAVEVRIVALQIELRLAWAMLLAGGLGLAAGLLLPRPRRRGRP